MPSSTRLTPTFTPPHTKSIASQGAPALQQRQGFSEKYLTSLSSEADACIEALLGTASSEVSSTLVSMDDLTRACSPEITMRKLSEIKALAQKIAKILDTKQEGNMTFETIKAAIISSWSEDTGNFLVENLNKWEADLKTKRKTVGTFERGEFYLMRKKWDELVKKIESALTKHRYAEERKPRASN
jgi:hypothetical protein